MPLPMNRVMIISRQDSNSDQEPEPNFFKFRKPIIVKTDES